MKENTGALILTALLISMIAASIAAYKVEAIMDIKRECLDL